MLIGKMIMKGLLGLCGIFAIGYFAWGALSDSAVEDAVSAYHEPEYIEYSDLAKEWSPENRAGDAVKTFGDKYEVDIDATYREVVTNVSRVKSVPLPDGVYSISYQPDSIDYLVVPGKEELPWGSDVFSIKNGRYTFVRTLQFQDEQYIKASSGRVAIKGFTVRFTPERGASEILPKMNTLIINRLQFKNDNNWGSELSFPFGFKDWSQLGDYDVPYIEVVHEDLSIRNMFWNGRLNTTLAEHYFNGRGIDAAMINQALTSGDRVSFEG